MADDGGSSGLLRRDMGMPPPGDLRLLGGAGRRRVALEPVVPVPLPGQRRSSRSQLHRLFMAALSEVTGDFELAVQESTRVLKVRGRVLPSTLDDVVLHAQFESGDQISGRHNPAAGRAPRRVWVTPASPAALPQAVTAIAKADLIVLGR
ncbi:MAG: 2-phospho-L-lactate transferase CofD family protein [Thermoleophilia bacterium]